MLRSLKELESYKIHAVDGEMGKVTGFLFDDQHWTIRYLIADTSGFLQGPHQVLVSPISFRNADWTTRLFNLNLTQEKVKNSPSVDLAQPVSRQYERDYAQYYGWPYYWGFGETWAWGMSAYPLAMIESVAKEGQKPREEPEGDPHLRSAKEIEGYHICGTDGEIGHVADFIVDDETWTIRYLVIDTSNWWFGKKVLVVPQWAHDISWAKSMVYMNLTKDAIKNSPTWDPEALVNREYEERLYDYYGRPVYWPRGEVVAKDKAGSVPPEPKHLSL